MKNFLFWFRTKLVSRRMKKFDKRKKITRKAHKAAERKGHSTFSVYGDFGRTLQHYAPIHIKLLDYAKNGIKGKRVLHIAASTGIYTRFLQEEGAIAIALDINPQAVSIAKKIGNEMVVRANVKGVIPVSIRENLKHFLSIKKSSIDFVVSDHFLFSQYDEIGDSRLIPSGSMPILNEIHRVLSPGGIAIIHYPKEIMPDRIKSGIMLSGFEIMEISQNPQSRDMDIAVLKKKN